MDIVEIFPNVTVVASKVALSFLQNLTHAPFKQLAVKGGDKVCALLLLLRASACCYGRAAAAAGGCSCGLVDTG